MNRAARSRSRFNRPSVSGVEYSALGQMLVDAHTSGHSGVLAEKDIAVSISGQNSLEKAYDDFFKANPGLAAEFGGDSSFDSCSVDFKELIPGALTYLNKRLGTRRAEVLRVYNRYYEEGDEGTGLHNDVDTGAHLVIVRTLYGSANFMCEGSGDSLPLDQVVGPGDVVAFRAEMPHDAGSPIDGPREIEGWAIKLA